MLGAIFITIVTAGVGWYVTRLMNKVEEEERLEEKKDKDNDE